MEIFAIGHSNYPYDKLINMIKKYDINCVVDIRETPYSKYNIQYNKEAFNESLRNSGFIYIYTWEKNLELKELIKMYIRKKVMQILRK